MKRKFPQMVKQLEVSLYRSAPSLQAYLDTTTLKTRMQQLTMEFALAANRSESRVASVLKEATSIHTIDLHYNKKIVAKDKEKEAALKLAREEIAMLKQSIAKKEMQLKGEDTEIAKISQDNAKKDEKLKGNELDIARKDKQIEYMKSVVKQQRNQIRQLESILDPADEVDSIRADLKSKREENDLLKSAITRKDEEIASLKKSLKNSKPIDAVDLTDTKKSSKRPRTEDTTKSALAIQHEQNMKMVKVKEEKVAVETALEDVREDLEDNQEDMGRQVLFTDFLQSKIDELAALAEAGGADRARVAEIKGRSYSSMSS